jgi:hypothetical protein
MVEISPALANRMAHATVAQAGSHNIADVTDTFGDLDEFRESGGKLLTFFGANDPLIDNAARRS